MTAFDRFIAALKSDTNHDGVLGDECVEFPPNDTVDYWATPQNAIVFGWMGVDGVHYAILKIDGEVRDDSPVIQIGPMDFEEPYSLLAPTFIDYLAIGCGCSPAVIEKLLAEEETGSSSLLKFMRERFQQSRFWADDVNRDVAPYRTLMISRPDGEPS